MGAERKAEEARLEAKRKAEEEKQAEQARLEAERKAEEARLEAEKQSEPKQEEVKNEEDSQTSVKGESQVPKEREDLSEFVLLSDEEQLTPDDFLQISDEPPRATIHSDIQIQDEPEPPTGPTRAPPALLSRTGSMINIGPERFKARFGSTRIKSKRPTSSIINVPTLPPEPEEEVPAPVVKKPPPGGIGLFPAGFNPAAQLAGLRNTKSTQAISRSQPAVTPVSPFGGFNPAAVKLRKATDPPKPTGPAPPTAGFDMAALRANLKSTKKP